MIVVTSSGDVIVVPFGPTGDGSGTGVGSLVVAKFLQRVYTVAASSNSTYTLSDDRAWARATCPYCGGTQMVVVAAKWDGNLQPDPHGTIWLMCPTCAKGSVLENGTLHPARQPMRVPAGLPPTDEAIWQEVRACLGVGANAAAVMLCRKLLFHIAVANGLPPKNERDRAPTFVEAVQHLENEGIVTAKMRPWVDRIKDVGNEVNHELTPTGPEQALDVAAFTEQLLVLAYEFDALMADPKLSE